MITNQSSEEAHKFIETSHPIIIDVRKESEYNRGHLKDAKLINIHNEDFPEKIQELDKEKTYLVYCAVGGRSSHAVQYMEENGFKEIFHLQHGIKEWNQLNFPIEK